MMRPNDAHVLTNNIRLILAIVKLAGIIVFCVKTQQGIALNVITLVTHSPMVYASA